jgi:sec-independent protein translocase protein TatC
MTFWEHLEVFRHVIFRVLAVSIAVAILAFVFGDTLFAIVLAPAKNDFILYRALASLGHSLGYPGIVPAPFHIEIISVELTSQFMISMSVALYAGLLIATPYILYELFRFVSPALYENERRYALRLVVSSYFLFMAGVALNYFLLFPLTFRFLATYQVNAAVANTITLSSYIDTLMMLTIAMGIIFEIPVLCWMLAKFRLLKSTFMKRYRKHAIVIILIAAAIITPTSDIFTLTIVSIPIYALYEISISIVRKVERHRHDVVETES